MLAASLELQSAIVTLGQLRGLVIDSACDGTLAGTPPEPWPAHPFENLVTPLHGGNTAPAADEAAGGVPILRSSSVRNGTIDLVDVRFVPEEQAENPRHFVADGDLLVTRLSGTADYVGNLAVVRGLNGRRIQFPDRLFRGRALDPAAADFLALAFRSTGVRRQIERLLRSATGQKRLTIRDVNAILIPVPPSQERDVVVVQAARLIDLIASLEARATSAQNRIERIRALSRSLAQDGALVATDATLARAEAGIEDLTVSTAVEPKSKADLIEGVPAMSNEGGTSLGDIVQALQGAQGRLEVGELFKRSGFKIDDGIRSGEQFYAALREAERAGLVSENRGRDAIEIVLSGTRAS